MSALSKVNNLQNAGTAKNVLKMKCYLLLVLRDSWQRYPYVMEENSCSAYVFF